MPDQLRQASNFPSSPGLEGFILPVFQLYLCSMHAINIHHYIMFVKRPFFLARSALEVDVVRLFDGGLEAWDVLPPHPEEV